MLAFSQFLEANYAIFASVAVLNVDHGHLAVGQGDLEQLECADTLFHLFATACILYNLLDNLGRVCDV